MPSKLTYTQIEARFQELDSKEAKVSRAPWQSLVILINNSRISALSVFVFPPIHSGFGRVNVALHKIASPPQPLPVATVATVATVADTHLLPSPPLLPTNIASPSTSSQLREFYAPTAKSKQKTSSAARTATPRHRYAGSLEQEDDAAFWVERRGAILSHTHAKPSRSFFVSVSCTQSVSRDSVPAHVTSHRRPFPPASTRARADEEPPTSH